MSNKTCKNDPKNDERLFEFELELEPLYMGRKSFAKHAIIWV